MRFAGIDIGSRTIEVAVMDEAGEIFSSMCTVFAESEVTSSKYSDDLTNKERRYESER